MKKLTRIDKRTMWGNDFIFSGEIWRHDDSYGNLYKKNGHGDAFYFHRKVRDWSDLRKFFEDYTDFEPEDNDDSDWYGQ